MPRTMPGATLSVSVVRIGDAVVVRLDGELDFGTAPLVDEALREAEDDGRLRRLVVDAADLTFIDASGLEPLLAAHARLGPDAMRLRDVRPPVRRVFELLSLTETFGLDS